MPEVVVEEGEAKRVIRADQADEDHQLEVLAGRGRAAHNRELAQQGEGDRILLGDRPKWRNLDDQPVWLYAEPGFGDLRVYISGTSFETEYQQRGDDAKIGTLESINNNDPELLANQQTMIGLLEQIEENTRA